MSFLSESFICLFKFFLTFELFFHYGLIKGLIIVYILFNAYRVLISKLFDVKHAGLDAPFITNNKNEKYNVVLSMTFEYFEPEKMKKLIIERGIMKLSRLRSIIVYKLFSYYWKEIRNREKLNKMIEEAFVYKEIKNEGELPGLVQEEVVENLEILSDEKFPYEFHLIKFKENSKGAVILKTDHVMSDGLGFVSFLCALADNYSPEMFPQVMRGKRKNIWVDILTILLFPINLFKLSLRILFNRPEKSPFKRIYETKHNLHQGRTKIAISNLYPIKKVENIKKSLKMSFNDITVSVVLFALKKKFPQLKNMNFILPTGLTHVPSSLEEVELLNQSGGTFLELPLIEDFERDIKTVSKTLYSNIKNVSFILTANLIHKLILEYLPHKLLCLANNSSLKKVDMILSNVPGPTTPLIYAGSKVIDMLPIISTGRAKVFLPIYSYNKQFRFFVNYDESVGIDPNELINTIDEILNDLEKKYSDRII